MKKIKIFLIVFLTLTIFSLSSQEKELDSINNRLKNYKKQDTVRVSMLIGLTKFYITRDSNKNLALIKEAILISNKINYKKGKGYSLNSYANYYLNKGNLDKALVKALEAKKILEEIKDTDNLIFNNNILGRIYSQNGKTKKALNIYLYTLELCKNKPKSENIAGYEFYAAKGYENINDFINAEKHYNNALNISKSLNFLTGINISISSLGVLNYNKENYQQAIFYFNKSLGFYKTNKQSYNIAHTYTSLSNAYEKQNKYKKAIDYNDKALVVFEKTNKYIALKDIYINQSKLFEKTNNYSKSNYYLKKHYAMVDTLFSIDKVSIIEDLQTKYETEKITIEKNNALTKSKQNKFYFISAVIIAGLILISSLFFIKQLRARKKAELITVELRETQKRLAIEKQYRDSELKALKSQMNPHFIFNALNSIQEYIVMNKKDLASNYLGKFSNLIRTYLHFSDTGIITLQQEIDSLKTYLELECLRFEDSLTCDINFTENINSEIIKIPTMLIQPYVENAIKHGLLHKREDRNLSVSFSKTDKNIKCIIEDNGVGRKKSKIIQAKRSKFHKPFAEKATKERLTLLNYGKNKKIGVKIIDLLDDSNTGIGTKVILTIPILN